MNVQDHSYCYLLPAKDHTTRDPTGGRLIYAGKGSRTPELLRETLLRRSPLTTWLSPHDKKNGMDRYPHQADLIQLFCGLFVYYPKTFNNLSVTATPEIRLDDPDTHLPPGPFQVGSGIRRSMHPLGIDDQIKWETPEGNGIRDEIREG